MGKNTEMLATGSSDAVINLWYDCTASDKEEAFRREVSCCFFFGFFFGCIEVIQFYGMRNIKI